MMMKFSWTRTEDIDIAKALSDMIIFIQSEPSSWESHLHCNGHSLLLNLRQPLKATVAAIAEHLAGLLLLHLVYGQAHETTIGVMVDKMQPFLHYITELENFKVPG
ncbi:hypothetical protein VNO77_39533 [Canavalia gladiata]|uniref:Uncharacterized protein n=1 Tax=Canavalia gladiata TaxID=3824 RepID=A0AAN9KDV0_CANGL